MRKKQRSTLWCAVSSDGHMATEKLRADVCQLSIPVAVGASIFRYRQGLFEGRGESRGMRGVRFYRSDTDGQKRKLLPFQRPQLALLKSFVCSVLLGMFFVLRKRVRGTYSRHRQNRGAWSPGATVAARAQATCKYYFCSPAIPCTKVSAPRRPAEACRRRDGWYIGLGLVDVSPGIR